MSIELSLKNSGHKKRWFLQSETDVGTVNNLIYFALLTYTENFAIVGFRIYAIIVITMVFHAWVQVVTYFNSAAVCSAVNIYTILALTSRPHTHTVQIAEIYL